MKHTHLLLYSFLAGLGLVFGLGSCDDGIYTQGNNSHVVYIQGEACAINMLPWMTEDTIRENFEFCLRTHKEIYP